MGPTADARDFLASPLLAEADEGARLALFEALEPGLAAPGDLLIAQGRPNARLWFFLAGSVAIVRRAGGADLPVAQLTAPGIFGATTFFRPGPATASIRAASALRHLTLGHEAHDRLRLDQPRAAEALALATVRVLAERFDLLDARLTEFMAARPDDQPEATEWAIFRARLFEEPSII